MSDVATRSRRSRPPLDKQFFFTARSTHAPQVDRISSYLKDVYNVDILEREYAEYDSLERVMTMIYADVFDPNLGDRATEMFRGLIRLFNSRLAETTNDIKPTQKRYLYRIIVYYLSKEVRPDDLTIITFNQDLQIEKILYRLSTTNRWGNWEVFNFPYCYKVPIRPKHITAPTGQRRGLFPQGDADLGGIMVLKLHGSLNWYSAHNSPKVSPQAMFNPKRVIRMTRRQTIDPDMTLAGRRQRYTLPVIVPPVTHKSSIIHEHIKPIWALAERRLKRNTRE